MTQQNKKVTSCSACNQTVAIGAKTCPHCGQKNPAPKPAFTLGTKHWALIIILAMGGLIIFSGERGTPPSKPSIEQVLKQCSKEVGIDPQSNEKVTMNDMRLIDACLNRHGVRTK